MEDVCKVFIRQERALGRKPSRIASNLGLDVNFVNKVLYEDGELRFTDLTDEQEKEICRLHIKDNKSRVELAKTFNVSPRRIRNTLENHKSGHAYYTLTREQVLSLPIRYVKGEGVVELAGCFGVSYPVIVDHLKSLGVKTSKYTTEKKADLKVDESVFDNPSEERDYWIGFLITDGCVSTSKFRPNPIITLTLQSRDEDHIRKFRKFMKTEDRKINHWQTKRKNGDEYSNLSTLSFTSRKVADKLSEFGVVPRKTNIEKVIGLENSRAFWRGVIDGDGCVTHNNQDNHAVITLSNGPDLCTQFINYIELVIGVPVSKNYPKKREGRDSYIVGLYSQNAYKVIKHLYSDCTIALDRKLAKAQEIISLYESADSAGSVVEEVANVSPVDYPQKQAS